MFYHSLNVLVNTRETEFIWRIDRVELTPRNLAVRQMDHASDLTIQLYWLNSILSNYLIGQMTATLIFHEWTMHSEMFGLGSAQVKFEAKE